MLLIPRSDQSLQPGPPTLAGGRVTARHLEICTRLYFPWAELSSLPAPSSSRSLHRWKISFLFWQNSKTFQRKTCLGTESGGIGIIGKAGKAVVYSFFSPDFPVPFFFLLKKKASFSLSGDMYCCNEFQNC